MNWTKISIQIEDKFYILLQFSSRATSNSYKNLIILNKNNNTIIVIWWCKLVFEPTTILWKTRTKEFTWQNNLNGFVVAEILKSKIILELRKILEIKSYFKVLLFNIFKQMFSKYFYAQLAKIFLQKTKYYHSD